MQKVLAQSFSTFVRRHCVRRYFERRPLPDALVAAPMLSQAVDATEDARRLARDGLDEVAPEPPLPYSPHLLRRHANRELAWSGLAERTMRRGLCQLPESRPSPKSAIGCDEKLRRLRRRVAFLASGYAAHALVALGERVISNDKPSRVLKFDLRDWVYEGRVW